MQRTFTIIIPVYKVEQYLDRCVESIVKQSFGDFEILLIDDGSPDNSPLMCDKWAEKDKRISVIHKENGGLAETRNVGIAAARGEYIIFVDSDDYLVSDDVFKLLYAELNCGVDVAAVDGKSNVNSYYMTHIYDRTISSGEEFLKKSLKEQKAPMAAWLYVYKRKFLEDNGLKFKEGILHEDEEFTPRVLLKAKRVLNTGIIFYFYHVRNNSITTASNKDKNMADLYSTCVELEKIYRNLADRKLKKLLLDSLVMKYLSLYRSGNFGKNYIHKKFVIKNSYRLKTRMKALLFCINTKFYCKVADAFG